MGDHQIFQAVWRTHMDDANSSRCVYQPKHYSTVATDGAGVFEYDGSHDFAAMAAYPGMRQASVQSVESSMSCSQMMRHQQSQISSPEEGSYVVRSHPGAFEGS